MEFSATLIFTYSIFACCLLQRTRAFVYDIPLRDHTLDDASNAEYISAEDEGINFTELYSIQSTPWPFGVDVPVDEKNTTCVQNEEVGSAHHPSCHITSVVLGNDNERQIFALGTVGSSGILGNVCTANGGFSCVAAYFDTESFNLQNGDRVQYSWNAKTTTPSNYYEFLVLLINSSSDSAIWGSGRRGIASSGNNVYESKTSGSYYLRFFVGGYLYNDAHVPREVSPDITFDSIQVDTVS